MWKHDCCWRSGGLFAKTLPYQFPHLAADVTGIVDICFVVPGAKTKEMKEISVLEVTNDTAAEVEIE